MFVNSSLLGIECPPLASDFSGEVSKPDLSMRLTITPWRPGLCRIGDNSLDSSSSSFLGGAPVVGETVDDSGSSMFEEYVVGT
mmetsp:Transcript_21021/g.52139  ORF Transcript_21021/g.52139 Transcript_21021/m.52139 type:complete len:83 (-) Transcript_21021:350-598(-)